MTSRRSGVRSRMTQITSEWQQPFDDRIRIGDVIVKDGDFGPASDGRPVRQLERDILIVIKDRDFHLV